MLCPPRISRSAPVSARDVSKRQKWDRVNAKLLLESLYRGYPVGTLLLWETAAPAGEGRIGSLTLPAPQIENALWVVDGQQRIVSLARILLAADPDEDAFALYFDLDAADFVIPPVTGKRRADPSRWLPMTVVLDSEKLMQWLFDHAADPSSCLLYTSPHDRSKLEQV